MSQKDSIIINVSTINATWFCQLPVNAFVNLSKRSTSKESTLYPLSTISISYHGASWPWCWWRLWIKSTRIIRPVMIYWWRNWARRHCWRQRQWMSMLWIIMPSQAHLSRAQKSTPRTLERSFVGTRESWIWKMTPWALCRGFMSIFMHPSMIRYTIVRCRSTDTLIRWTYVTPFHSIYFRRLLKHVSWCCRNWRWASTACTFITFLINCMNSFAENTHIQILQLKIWGSPILQDENICIRLLFYEKPMSIKPMNDWDVFCLLETAIWGWS